MQVFLQILNPVKNAEILAPELVGVQSEMVASEFCHTLVITGKPSYTVHYSIDQSHPSQDHGHGELFPVYLEEHMEAPLVLCQRMTGDLVHETLQPRSPLLDEVLLVDA